MNALRILPVVGFALLAACDSGTSPDADRPDRIVEGVNLTELFAAPSQAEIAAMLAEWSGRDPQGTGVVELRAETVMLGFAPAALRIISHEVDGNSHVGAILTPSGAAAGTLPLLLFAHGGDHGISLDDAISVLPLIMGDLLQRFVYVVPTFRSEPLSYQGSRYVSEGTPSPWDRDVDDALALLDVARETVPQADPERVAVVGSSRGACVGLLMGIRNVQIDIVAEFAGPTDFFGPFVQQAVENALLGNPPNLPGADYLDATFIQPLKRGEVTIADVRRELLRRSPVYFANLLPDLQVHHGRADDVVPVTEAERLIDVMEALGRHAPEFEGHLYAGLGHESLYHPGAIEHLRRFLQRLFD